MDQMGGAVTVVSIEAQTDGGFSITPSSSAVSAGHCNNSASFSAGVLKPNVFLGRSLSSFATLFKFA